MLNKLECIILGHLVRKPDSGFGIFKWLEHEGPFFGYTPQPSQIYRQLSKCLESGWLSVTIDKNTSGPEAKMYRLTDLGLATFTQWAESEYVPTVRPLDADFQMRFLLTGILGPEIALKLLTTELEYRRAQQHERAYSDPIDTAEAAITIDPDWGQELARLGRERGYLLGTTYLTWLEMAHARLSERTTTSLNDPS